MSNEFKELRNQYAKEDLEILKEYGYLAITETTIGNIFCEIQNGLIVARNQMGELLTGEHMNESLFVSWLSSKYVIEV